jgi:hypothetical protein
VAAPVGVNDIDRAQRARQSALYAAEQRSPRSSATRCGRSFPIAQIGLKTGNLWLPRRAEASETAAPSTPNGQNGEDRTLVNH